MNKTTKNIYALFFAATLLLLGSIPPIASIIVYGDDQDFSTPTQSTKIIKNEKWIALEKETATMQFRLSSEINPEAASQYLFDKYDGAEMYSVRSGLGQRLQNGGWNVYYKTAAGKQTARTAYNGMFLAAFAGVAVSGAIGAFGTTSGVGAIAGVAATLLALANKTLVSYSKSCRDNVDKNGNTGTALHS